MGWSTECPRVTTTNMVEGNRTEAFWPRISDLENDMQGLSLDLPTGYYLERDPDVLILRRLDGSMVGAFSARGAAPEAVRRMVEETVGEEPSASSRRPRPTSPLCGCISSGTSRCSATATPCPSGATAKR